MSILSVGELVQRSREAQIKFEQFDQARVDAFVRAIAKTIYDNAEGLARMAVDETRMGVYEDKIKKNRGKASIIWWSLQGKKSVGIINRNESTGIVEVARPMGVVGAVTPCTNPIVTPMSNAMFALKGRNSVVFAPHPRAKKCTKTVVELFMEAIRPLGAPEYLIQTLEEPSIEASGELMRSVDVIVATGGMGMVKAAYSSGKPAYGVGAGNVQVIIDRNVDIEAAAAKIIAGRIFDNGIICSGEQCIIVHEDDLGRMLAALKANGAYVALPGDETNRLRKAVFPNGVMNKDLVGQSVRKVSEASGIALPEGVKAIVALAEGAGHTDPLCAEKMCPVLAILTYKTFSGAVALAAINLNAEGKGHSVSIHSLNSEHIEYAAETLPVSRVLINQICSTMNGGSFFNGLTPTTTLGCGSWGNNSISENFGYKHLINVTRIAYDRMDNHVPTDEELWG